MRVFHIPLEFEWDKGNSNKNFGKHGVTDTECEEIFFDHHKRIVKDAMHSGHEARYIVIGKTKTGRILFAAYTIRKQKIRIISARNLNKKERHLYEEKI